MWYGRRVLKSHEGSMSVALTEIRRQKLPNYPEPPLGDSCILRISASPSYFVFWLEVRNCCKDLFFSCSRFLMLKDNKCVL